MELSAPPGPDIRFVCYFDFWIEAQTVVRTTVCTSVTLKRTDTKVMTTDVAKVWWIIGPASK